MPSLRFAYYLSFLALLIVAPGCVSLHGYRPVGIQLQDAETKQPIAGADVSVWYPVGLRTATLPQESAAVSAGDGMATLRIAPYGDAGIMLTGRAKGYLSEEMSVPVEKIKQIEPESWFRKEGRRPPSIVLEMYREPKPAIELILPKDYHGIVRVKLAYKEDMPWKPGQRSFLCPVPDSGIALAQVPVLLQRFNPPDYRARYEKGPVLSRDASPDQVGFHWLKFKDGEEYFVVGTQNEYEHFHSLIQPEEHEGRPAGGSRKGGGGRRHLGRDGNRDITLPDPMSGASPPQ